MFDAKLTEQQRANFYELITKILPLPPISLMICIVRKFKNLSMTSDTCSLLVFLESLSTKADKSLKEINSKFPLNENNIDVYVAILQGNLDHSIVHFLISQLSKFASCFKKIFKKHPPASFDEIKQKVDLCESIVYFRVHLSEPKLMHKLMLSDLLTLEKIHNNLYKNNNILSLLLKQLNDHDYCDYYSQKLFTKILFWSEKEQSLMLKYFEATNLLTQYFQILLSTHMNIEFLSICSDSSYLTKFYEFVHVMGDNLSSSDVQKIRLFQTLDKSLAFSFLDHITNNDKQTILKELSALIRNELKIRLIDFHSKMMQ